MINVAPKLWIGTISEIPAVPTFKIVNTSHTHHYLLHEWRLRDGVDHSSDPCYIICEDEQNMISVNWVDANDAKYFDYNGQGLRIFKRLLDYIDLNRGAHDVLIACNKGESRAPSLAMVYLAKKTALLGEPADAPYQTAREKFSKLYPAYLPNSGITEFLISNWHKL